MDNWYIQFGNSSYPYLFALAFLLIAVSALYYRRTIPQLSLGMKFFLFAFRSLAIILIILFLCFPTLILTETRSTGEKLAILIDRSGSMEFEEEEAQSRLSEVKNTLESKVLPNLNKELLIYSFSDSILSHQEIAEISPDSNLTALGNAIKALRNSDNALDIGGILIVSDGNSNLGSDALHEALRADIPISAIGIGDTIPIPDISVEDIKAPEIVYRGEEIDLTAILKSDVEDEITANLSLYQEKKRIKSQTVMLPGGGAEKEVQLSIDADSIGKFSYRLSINSDFKEQFTKNNARSISVQVLKDRLKILLIAEKPNWEYSFLKRELLTNDKYQVSSYIPGPGNRIIESPETTELDVYDCVILIGCGVETYNRFGRGIGNLYGSGNLNAAFLLSPNSVQNPFRRILRQIDLIFEGASPIAQNGQFIPDVVNENIPDPLLRLPKGESHNQFADMPPLQYQLLMLQPAEQWDIVMNGHTDDGRVSPLLMKSTTSGNRLVVINGGPIWRWHFYMNRKDEQDKKYSHLINNMVTWLTVAGQTKPIDLDTDKSLYTSGEQVKFRGRILDENYRPIGESSLIVKLRDESGNEINFELAKREEGNFEGSPGRLTAGSYDYRAYAVVSGDTIETLDGRFQVEQFSEEYRTITANRKLLREIADVSGGVYWDIEDDVKNPLPIKQDSITEKDPINLASLPAALIAALLLLVVEWAIRKRKQLP
ncbi:MAG: hypothetical protein GF315_06285 [candidate division Zixibacteria bacterium]|nr:hypothetical protein [candidate division Zixibacteria bacterium]